jgi:hypothetical protein
MVKAGGLITAGSNICLLPEGGFLLSTNLEPRAYSGGLWNR